MSAVLVPLLWFRVIADLLITGFLWYNFGVG